MPAIPSGFGFTGEQTAPSNDLVYLRAISIHIKKTYQPALAQDERSEGFERFF